MKNIIFATITVATLFFLPSCSKKVNFSHTHMCKVSGDTSDSTKCYEGMWLKNVSMIYNGVLITTDIAIYIQPDYVDSNKSPYIKFRLNPRPGSGESQGIKNGEEVKFEEVNTEVRIVYDNHPEYRDMQEYHGKVAELSDWLWIPEYVPAKGGDPL